MVCNVHERTLPVPAAVAGRLLDGLGGADDRLWPRARWPRIRLDGPLRTGTAGGHGPIRYRVEAHEPGRQVSFRFTAPAGFDGSHGFEVQPLEARQCRLRHVLAMRTHGRARLTWPFLYRPLHDALIEDALATAEIALGLPARWRRWSPWVRALRALFMARRALARRTG